MKSEFYKIKCITNLHMGSGDINFNIIDNEVQRDPVTGYASMYSSGIKGALRDHFKNNNQTEECVEKIFGSDIKKSNASNKDQSVPGSLKFLSANLLLIPVCSSDNLNVYYMVTTKEILLNAVRQMNDITGNCANLLEEINKLEEESVYRAGVLKDTKDTIIIGLDGISLEVKNPIPEKISLFINEILGENGENIIIVPDAEYRKVELPVLARNQLENGISKNLWYEQVVPHEAVFVFGVLSDGTPTGNKIMSDFAGVIASNSIIQFGGNATVGYGLTKVSKLPLGGGQQ